MLFERLEAQDADGGNVQDWDFHGWVGRNAGARASGGATRETRWVAGIRLWF